MESVDLRRPRRLPSGSTVGQVELPKAHQVIEQGKDFVERGTGSRGFAALMALVAAHRAAGL